MIGHLDVHVALQRAEWDAYVTAKADSTCYHLSAWPFVADRAYALRTRLLAARRGVGGELTGAMALVVVPRPFNRYVTTGIFGSYGPILADDDGTRTELLRAAMRFTDEIGARYLHVKSLEPCALDGAALDRHDVWVRATLPLDGGADAVWKRQRSSIRAAVRQALRFGLTSRVALADLDAFYDVLSDNMHRKGAPTYGFAFFRALVEQLGARAEVLTVRLADRVIAGALAVRYGRALTIPFAGSLKAFLRYRPNNLLYWRLIERACELGLDVLDFGSSLRDSSALAFKCGWGARVEPVASLVYAPRGPRPVLGPSGAGVQVGTRFWRRLPRAAADAFGPSVSRLMA